MPEQVAQADPTVVFVLTLLMPTIAGLVAAIIGLINRREIHRVKRTADETAHYGREERLKRERERDGGDGLPPCP